MTICKCRIFLNKEILQGAVHTLRKHFGEEGSGLSFYPVKGERVPKKITLVFKYKDGGEKV